MPPAILGDVTDPRTDGPLHGDGFVILADGTRRWGIYGAAGVLFRHRGEAGTHYFLALRSRFTHRGGTWAMPGGALDRDETPLDGAMREFSEEIGHGLVDRYEVAETYVDDHGGWSYTTLVVDVPEMFPAPHDLDWETEAVRWVHESDLPRLDLFDSFEATLRRLGML